jgi:hypothetical protein
MKKFSRRIPSFFFKTKIRKVFSAILLVVLLIVLGGYVQINNNNIQEWYSFVLELLLIGLLLSICYLKWNWKIVSSCIAVFIVILLFSPLALIVLMAGGMLLPGNGVEQEMHSLQVGDSYLVVYQNNCGATCDLGIDITLETPYLLGVLKTTRTIASYYPGNDIQFEKIDNEHVRVISEQINAEIQHGRPVPAVGDIWDLLK